MRVEEIGGFAIPQRQRMLTWICHSSESDVVDTIDLLYRKGIEICEKGIARNLRRGGDWVNGLQNANKT